jgi:uncharacterized protein involved in response to NO
MAKYLQIRPLLDSMVLTPGSSDRVTWWWSASGQYSTRSAYCALFVDQCSMLGAKELWKVKAPRKCFFSIWLALQDWCWTVVRCRWHGLQDNDTCALCSQ